MYERQVICISETRGVGGQCSVSAGPWWHGHPAMKGTTREILEREEEHICMYKWNGFVGSGTRPESPLP